MSDRRLTDRVMSKVWKTDTCWVWLGYVNRGYGQIWVDRKPLRVHRVVYEEARGPIPSDRVIDHLCRTRFCVNPDHMEAVSNRENVLRGVGISAQNARKTVCKMGHPFDAANTRLWGRKGERRCRKCNAMSALRYWRKTYGRGRSDTPNLNSQGKGGDRK